MSKPFAQILKDNPGLFTAEVREAFEAFYGDCDWSREPSADLMKLLRHTPPAKDAVSMECCVARVDEYAGGSLYATILLPNVAIPLKANDRVVITKKEQP